MSRFTEADERLHQGFLYFNAVGLHPVCVCVVGGGAPVRELLCHVPSVVSPTLGFALSSL